MYEQTFACSANWKCVWFLRKHSQSFKIRASRVHVLLWRTSLVIVCVLLIFVSYAQRFRCIFTRLHGACFYGCFIYIKSRPGAEICKWSNLWAAIMSLLPLCSCLHLNPEFTANEWRTFSRPALWPSGEIIKGGLMREMRKTLRSGHTRIIIPMTLV